MLRTLATWVKPWRTLSSGRCPERASPRKLFRAVVQVITARLPGLEQVVEALLLGGPWLGRPRWPRTPWREQSRTEGCFKETGVARAVQGRLVQRGCPALGRAEGGPWSEGEPGWVGLAESLSLRDAEWPGQAPAHTCSWKRDPPGRRPEAPGLGTGPRRLPRGDGSLSTVRRERAPQTCCSDCVQGGQEGRGAGQATRRPDSQPGHRPAGPASFLPPVPPTCPSICLL